MKRRSSGNSGHVNMDVGKKYLSSLPMYTLVTTVAVVCYINGLNGEFVHDDIPAVTLNRDVLALNPIRDVLRNDFWGTPMADISSHKSYRPLTTLTFRANYLCFGLYPPWFHAANIVLHTVACILFTRVCLSVAGLKRSFATLGGLLFAVHPIHTEAVTGIVGRADVLACIFFLLSLLAYHRPNGSCCIWTSIILGGLSMLAKETGISIFGVNLAYDFYKCWPWIKRTISQARWTNESQQFTKRAAKILTLLGILLTIRLAMLQGSLPRFSQQDNPAAFHPSLHVRILTFSYLAAFNWWLLLCPTTLSHDWQMGSIPLITSIGDLRNLITCLFFGLALLLVMKSVIDFELQQHAPLVLGCLLLFIPFLPASNLIVTVGFVVAERVLYIPSTGYILLIAYGVQLMWNMYSRHRQIMLSLVLLILSTSSVRCLIRNKDWKSRESILRAGLIALPHNAKMHYNFANFLRDSGRLELAKSHYKTALKLWPTYVSAHNNLGTILNNKNEAERHFLMAIRYSVDHVNSHYNLGQLYRKANRTTDSERILIRCISLDPTFIPAYTELAKLWGPKHRNVGSLLQRLLLIYPTDPHFKTLYAHWLLNKGNRIVALKYYWQTLALVPAYTKAMIGAGRALRRSGDHGRLFQLVTRWHLILREYNGQTPSKLHIYLHEWHLKNELRNKAKAYDGRPFFYQNTLPKLNSFSTKKWNHVSSNKTTSPSISSDRRFRRGKQTQKYRMTTSLLIPHMLDTV